MPTFFDKSHFVRLVDVFALGPFMIYFAYEVGNVTETEKAFLAASEITTILYNGQNYLGTAGFGIPKTNDMLYVFVWIASFLYYYSTME